MNAERKTDNKVTTKAGPLPGLLRPPLVFLTAILLGLALNRAWPIGFVPSTIRLIGPILTIAAALLFLLSFREFRRAGTFVRGSNRTTMIVRTGPYRFSRNPIYASFILLMLGLAVWLNDLWVLITIIQAAGFIAMIVIPREERFLELNFRDQYLSYKTNVRRWF
jgi:protein-S-isoprenylcysteine O-methyltransferase Ste14